MRRSFFANRLHKQLFLLFFTVAFLPTLIITIVNYSLFLGVVADRITSPEASAYEISVGIDQTVKWLVLSTILVSVLIVLYAHRISHKIVGPFDRIVRDLDKRVKGLEQGPIKVRKNDKFRPLVSKINQLMEKYEKK